MVGSRELTALAVMDEGSTESDEGSNVDGVLDDAPVVKITSGLGSKPHEPTLPNWVSTSSLQQIPSPPLTTRNEPTTSATKRYDLVLLRVVGTH